MEFLITDGETFFHEEKRDLKSAISYIQGYALRYRIESADPQGRIDSQKKSYRTLISLVFSYTHNCRRTHNGRTDCKYMRCSHPIWESGAAGILRDGFKSPVTRFF